MKAFFNYSIPNQRSFKEKLKIRHFIEFLFKREGKILKRIDYIFCDDLYLLSINQSFLNHDYFTDIITFDLSEKKDWIIGEVYISVDRIKENAKFFSVTTNEERLRVIIHGALHLCGYKDKKKTDKEIMRQKENEYLLQFIKFKST